MSSTSRETILITAGSGNIGRRLIPLLLSALSAPKLILPTSSAAKLHQAYPDPPTDRLVVEEGSIQDPQWIQSIITTHSVSAVFLCLTGDNELFTTLNFLDAMTRSKTVKHLVYLSACGDFSLSAIETKHALQGVSAPHAVVKFIVEAKLRYGMPSPTSPSGFTYTVIGPSLFFDNDLRSKASLLGKEGLFDQPIGSKGVSRVAPGDIALAVCNALIHDRGQKYHDKKIMVGSLKTYASPEIAAIWSRALGKEVSVAGSDAESLDAFEGGLRTKVGPSWARDMRLMYEIFETKVFGMTEEEYEMQVELLGKEAESYERFVEETARKWLE